MASPATKKSTTKKRTTSKKNQSTNRKWKRAKAVELEVPSGNIALVKRPGMEVFLFEGLLPDALMPMVQDAIKTGQGLPPEKVKNLGEDLNSVQDMMDTMDRVTARVLVEPKVLWHKREKADGSGVEEIPEDERIDQDGVLYTDDIDFDDKSFIFQYAVGGTADLERFRSESDAAMESVRHVDDAPRPTKRTARAPRSSS